MSTDESAPWQVSEEVKFEPKVMIDKLERRQTFHQSQLEHGDILVVQPLVPEVSLTCCTVSRKSLSTVFQSRVVSHPASLA